MTVWPQNPESAWVKPRTPEVVKTHRFKVCDTMLSSAPDVTLSAVVSATTEPDIVRVRRAWGAVLQKHEMMTGYLRRCLAFGGWLCPVGLGVTVRNKYEIDLFFRYQSVDDGPIVKMLAEAMLSDGAVAWHEAIEKVIDGMVVPSTDEVLYSGGEMLSLGVSHVPACNITVLTLSVNHMLCDATSQQRLLDCLLAELRVPGSGQQLRWSSYDVPLEPGLAVACLPHILKSLHVPKYVRSIFATQIEHRQILMTFPENVLMRLKADAGSHDDPQLYKSKFTVLSALLASTLDLSSAAVCQREAALDENLYGNLFHWKFISRPECSCTGHGVFEDQSFCYCDFRKAFRGEGNRNLLKAVTRYAKKLAVFTEWFSGVDKVKSFDVLDEISTGSKPLRLIVNTPRWSEAAAAAFVLVVFYATREGYYEVSVLGATATQHDALRELSSRLGVTIESRGG